MPKLAENSRQRPCTIAGRFTAAEQENIHAAAESHGMSPSGFAREAILSAVQATPIERLILGKICETQALLKLFFGGLLAQLNEKDSPFTREKFAKMIEAAAEAQGRKVDELLRQLGGRHA